MTAAGKLSDDERAELAAELAELRRLAERIAIRYGLTVSEQPDPIEPPRRRRRTRIAAAAAVSEDELVDVAAAARGLGFRVREGR